jgi:membrane protein
MPASQQTRNRPKSSLWHMSGVSSRQLIKNVIREIHRDDLFGAASNLAFNWLLALFPLLVFLLALFGLFASHYSQLEDTLLFFSTGLLPRDAFQLLGGVARELAANSGSGKVTLGLVAALWFASGGVSALISTLNVAYRVRETRSWWKVRGIALAITLGISMLLLSALFIVVIGDRFLDWLEFRLRFSSVFLTVWRELQWPAAVLFVAVSFSLIDYFGPNLRERSWHWFTPGSVFGVILWIVSSAGFRVYLHFFNNYSKTYGSLGAVMILVIWLYVTGLAFLIGGAINAEIERGAIAVPAPETPLSRPA